MAFVTQFSQAQDIAIRFSAFSRSHESEFFQRFNSVERWYYFPDAGIFAPDKFIEYREAAPNHNCPDNIITNSNADEILEQWFYPLDGNTSRYKALALSLNHFLVTLGHPFDREMVGNGQKIWVPYSDLAITYYPDDVSAEYYREDSVRSVLVNAYERNPKARLACIEYYGCVCYVCHFDFAKVYGDVGQDYIQVHHLKELELISDDYEINPIADLRPLCPNCHAMIHRTRPAMSPEALRSMIDSVDVGSA